MSAGAIIRIIQVFRSGATGTIKTQPVAGKQQQQRILDGVEVEGGGGAWTGRSIPGGLEVLGQKGLARLDVRFLAPANPYS